MESGGPDGLILNNILYWNSPVDTPQPVTVYSYAIETIHKNTNGEDINLNYQQNRQPAIHGAISSLQSMSAYGSISAPLALYASVLSNALSGLRLGEISIWNVNLGADK